MAVAQAGEPELTFFSDLGAQHAGVNLSSVLRPNDFGQPGPAQSRVNELTSGGQCCVSRELGAIVAAIEAPADRHNPFADAAASHRCVSRLTQHSQVAQTTLAG